jgi:hypothetical protein
MPCTYNRLVHGFLFIRINDYHINGKTCVLELLSGTIEKTNTKKGDFLNTIYLRK